MYLPQVTNFFGNFPDGEQFREPIGRVATSAIGAIAQVETLDQRLNSNSLGDNNKGANGQYNEKRLGPIALSIHPEYQREIANYDKWRLAYEAGDHFINRYLTQFSNRETSDDYNRRLLFSPIPAFAKAGINEIKNSIFQRIADVVRSGGPETYNQ